MFIKDRYSQESYIHVCNDLSEKQMRDKEIEIRLHDVSVFALIPDLDGNGSMERIKFCPYCGCDLLKESNN